LNNPNVQMRHFAWLGAPVAGLLRQAMLQQGTLAAQILHQAQSITPHCSLELESQCEAGALLPLLCDAKAHWVI